MKRKTYYDVLGVESKAKPAELKRAYRKKARSVHPDTGGDHAKMAEINTAYDCLSDPARRLLYDKTGVDSTKSFDEEVQSILLAAFSDALGAGVELCLVHARNFIEQQKLNVTKQLEEARKAEKRFTGKRDKITTKKTNVFQLLIDQQLIHIQEAVATIEHQLLIFDASLKELDGYKSSEVVAAKPVMGSVYAQVAGGWAHLEANKT